MEQELIPLSGKDRFQFACHPGVPCFNECCRDLSQSLTPYDILRLKQGLGLSSSEFLQKYTSQFAGPETGLPVAVLRQDLRDNMECPFVTSEGCAVYENRPSSCRTYPLARLASRSRETGEITEQYVYFQEPHCRGEETSRTQSVADWVEAQELEPYNRMNDLMLELIALKKQLHPAPLDIRERQIFHTACYDLDNFRTQVAQGILKNLRIPPEVIKAAEADEAVLLRLGIIWVKHALFDIDPTEKDAEGF